MSKETDKEKDENVEDKKEAPKVTSEKKKPAKKAPEKDEKRAKIIVITSGKGGVGKTTTSAAIGSGLAMKGFKTVVIDFDVGLRNLDLIMGCERRVVYDFINLINKESNINQTYRQLIHPTSLTNPRQRCAHRRRRRRSTR